MVVLDVMRELMSLCRDESLDDIFDDATERRELTLHTERASSSSAPVAACACDDGGRCACSIAFSSCVASACSSFSIRCFQHS